MMTALGNDGCCISFVLKHTLCSGCMASVLIMDSCHHYCLESGGKGADAEVHNHSQDCRAQQSHLAFSHEQEI